MESLYYAGRPAAKAYAYGIFEGPELGASFLAGGPGGVGTKVTKDVIFEVAEEYIDHPEKVAEGLANAMMKKGLEAYRRNYSRYKQWKSGNDMSMRERDAFAQDFQDVNYYALGKELWGDVRLYKHKQGKYKNPNADMREFGDLLKGELARAAKASKAWDVATTATRVKGIVDAARDGLTDYQPYKDHLDRVREIERSDDFELPHARVGRLTQSRDHTKEPAPQYKTPPARPSVDVYKAIELGNAEQVWANIYYKTFDINGGRRRIPPLFYTFNESLKVQQRTRKPSEAHNHIIRLLLDKGANPNANFDNVTPLYLAVKYPNIEVAKALLAKGAEVNVSVRRETPLEIAAERGDLKMVRLLVAHKARINGNYVRRSSSRGVVYSGSGETPLYAAVDNGHVKVACYLLTKGADINIGIRYGGMPLHAAIKNSNILMARALLQHGAKVNARTREGMTPLHMAAARGRPELIQLLLQTQADVNARTPKRDETPLVFAIKGKHHAVVKALLKAGADVRIGRPLVAAASVADMPLIELLVSKGADPRHATVLEAAIRACSRPTYSSYRKRPSSPSASTCLAVVQYLVFKGAPVRPEHIWPGVSSGSIDMVRFLVSKGGDPRLKTESGTTPLHHASAANYKTIAEFLIAKGADMDSGDSSKLTALHLACKRDSRSVAILLVESGALINPLDKHGRTPFDYALTVHRQALAVQLRKYGLKHRMTYNRYKGYDVRTRKWNGAPFGGGGVVIDWKSGDEKKRWKETRQ